MSGDTDPAVAALAALCPSLPPEFVAFALRSRFRSDAHAAADWLLDGDAPHAAHAAWADARDAQRREEQEASAARDELRSGILERCASL